MEKFRVPVVAGKVILTSPFRPPDIPDHNGIDLAPRPRGNPAIYAFDDGEILVSQRNNPSAGNWLEILHGNGLVSTYMHLDTITAGLPVGTRVHKKQKIGTMGNTGRSSGIHLHFELRTGRDRSSNIRNAFDPLPMLLGRTTAATAQRWPLSPENIRRMVARNVISTPEFWYGVDSIQWLDELLKEAGEYGRLDYRIDNGISDLETALKVLEMAGIMNSPDYWRGQVQNSDVRFLDRLIISMANRSLDPLHRIVWAEARGEPPEGQIAVANVVINRHDSPEFPNGIYNVIHQPPNQFSPVWNGAYAAAEPCWQIKNMVDKALCRIDHSQGALFFNGTHLGNTSWAARNRRFLFDLGGHSFFA